MRLVVFGPGHPFRGGIPRATSEMVLALAAAGHQVHFLCARSQYPRMLFPGRSDRDPEACPPVADAEPLLAPFEPSTWFRSRRWARERAADAWLFPYWTWVWAGCWRFLLGGRRPPTVAVVHNPEDHGAGIARKIAARLVLSRCDGLFTHGASLRQRLAESYPGVPARSHPLPAPVCGRLPDRAEARARYGLGPEQRVALFWGLIRPYKGVDVLVEAIGRLGPGSDWRALVCGEPWEGLGPRLERQVAESGLGERVSLRLGWVVEAEVPWLLAAADVVVLPYRAGSQSAVAPIALAHGLPVISTSVGGLAEVIEHDVNGRLVAPGSARELAAALETLDRTTLERLATGAGESARRLTWHGYAAALTELLEEVREARGG